MIEPIRYDSDGLSLLDQRLLPGEERWVSYRDVPAVVEAIRTMVVRGAPAIGVTAAFGLSLAARGASGRPVDELRAVLHEAAAALVAARPTAVNLEWAVARALAAGARVLDDGGSAGDAARAIETEAISIRDEDVKGNRALGRHGSLLVPEGATILTHCNAGALATAGYGTALGVVRAAVEEGKKVAVLADETRPFLQGARLTAWELAQDGIPVSVIADGMAASLMARGEVDLVIVGADRIARNGDVANKVGTYGVAVLARRHGIPFYVAAPVSTIDPHCPSGDLIPIEERSPEEMTHMAGQRIVPEGVPVRHPAFDVTPAELVTAIITDAGLARAPYSTSLSRLLGLEPPARAEAEPDPPTVETGPTLEPEPSDEAEDDLF